MIAYVERSIHNRREFQITLKQGVQSFRLDYFASRRECEWMAKMFDIALGNHWRETMMNFEVAVSQIDQEIAKLQRVRAVLVEFSQNGTESTPSRVYGLGKRKRILSASARARISAAQRARWAKWKKERA